MSNLKTVLNFYWSFRRFIFGNFPLLPLYYLPGTKPSVTADKVLMVRFGEDRLGKLNYSFPTIFCVAKNDPEGQKLAELVNAVVEICSSPGSGRKTFPFYDQVINAKIGYVEIMEVKPQIVVPYSEGYIQKAIDLELRYVAEQRHL